MQKTIVIGSLMVASTVCGYTSDDNERKSGTRAAAPVHAKWLCSGGIEHPLDLQVNPLRTERDTNGENVLLRLALKNNMRGDATTRLSIELIDDHGNAIRPVEMVPAAALRRAAAVVRDFASPKGLEDGFYEYRVRAVGKAGEQSSAAEARFHFQVQQGDLILLSEDDWFVQSGVNQGA